MDWEDCKWIVRSYMDCKIAGFGTVGVVLPRPPFVPRVCQKGFGGLYMDWEDCI